jgi:hypothetical protein
MHVQGILRVRATRFSQLTSASRFEMHVKYRTHDRNGDMGRLPCPPPSVQLSLTQRGTRGRARGLQLSLPPSSLPHQVICTSLPLTSCVLGWGRGQIAHARVACLRPIMACPADVSSRGLATWNPLELKVALTLPPGKTQPSSDRQAGSTKAVRGAQSPPQQGKHRRPGHLSYSSQRPCKAKGRASHWQQWSKPCTSLLTAWYPANSLANGNAAAHNHNTQWHWRPAP